ncbi:MAG: alpha/beta fold hydrolase, partial [Bdellovibrionota bacterium]
PAAAPAAPAPAVDVDSFVDYSRDLAQLLRHLKRGGHLEKPFALVGHSMGGLVTLRFLMDESFDAPKPGAAVLSSPLLGVALAVPPVKDFAARMMNRVWPSITLYNEIKTEDLVRDSEWLKSYEKDALRHDKISPALYLGMFEVIEEVKRSGSKIKIPILVQAAGQERIVSLQGIKDFFPALGSTNKKLIVYDESYHEIYNDLDRETVFKDLDNFVASALGLRK